MRVFALMFAVFLSGCVARNHCTPNNCNGCCDPSGLCLDGTTQDACGSRGAMCSVCSGTSTCGGGVCLGAGAGTAGGLSGGGATGGGSAGGVSGPTFGVLFLWSFSGQTCAQAAVSNVVVTIGNTSVRNQAFRCNTAGTDGVVVQGVRAGSFTATLEGRDATNALKFRGTAQVRVVDQDVSVQVRLEPVTTSGPGDVLLSWRFPPLSVSNTPTCAQATITTVSVSVNGGSARDSACSAGEGSSSVRFGNLNGSTSFALAAADANGFVYFRKTTSVQPAPNTSTPVTVALDWAVGALPVKWRFQDGAQTQTCAQAGISSVFVNLRTSTGTFVYANAGAEVPCDEPMFGQGTVFPYLPPGTYDVFFQAVGTGGKLFKTNQTSPPRVSVSAGQFPTVDASVMPFVLTP